MKSNFRHASGKYLKEYKKTGKKGLYLFLSTFLKVWDGKTTKYRKSLKNGIKKTVSLLGKDTSGRSKAGIKDKKIKSRHLTAQTRHITWSLEYVILTIGAGQ